MRFGYISMNSASGIGPGAIARELEERGFDSLWVPEHSHIPTSRTSAFPAGGDLPEGYLHMMSPFVSLAAAAETTTELVLATGVCLLLEHDVLDLACQTATLDVLSKGRLLLGAGVGWNVEELANHRPDVPFPQRYSAIRERVAALRTAWGDDEAEFSGKWDRFQPSWVYPKPTRGRVPIAFGNSGPLGMLNEDGRSDVEGGVARFRDLVAANGRDPAGVPISLFLFSRPTPERLERFAKLGLERVVLSFENALLQPESATLHHLDSLTAIVEDWRAA
jgi:probable F420-dependent oxidoreductase